MDPEIAFLECVTLPARDLAICGRHLPYVIIIMRGDVHVTENLKELLMV
jgi:hypothetical protein